KEGHSMLSDLLPRDHLQHKTKATDWVDAITIASQPLLKKGVIEEEYIQKMVDSVNDNGPYIVLKDYFALLHARAGDGVNEMGMSLLTLDTSVDLKGNPVKIFLVLAAVDSSSHLDALSEISELLMNEDNYQMFLNGSLDEIYQLIK